MAEDAPRGGAGWAEGAEATAQLAKILRRVGLRPSSFELVPREEMEDRDISTIDELEEGFHESGLLVFGGRPMLVYIRDHTVMTPNPLVPERCRKVHFTVCAALQGMERKGRFDRYRRTGSDTNSYVIDVSDGWRGSREKRVRLLPCQFCLGNARYAGFYRAAMTQGERRQITQEFDAKVMFGIMKRHLREWSGRHAHRPFERLAEVTRMFIRRIEDTKPATEPGGYGADWKEVSRAYRRRQRWVCECCGVRLDGPGHHHLLDTHHRNGDKGDDREGNLAALCKLCHRGRDGHYPVRPIHAEKIRAARREQGIPGSAGAGHLGDGGCGHG